MHWSRPRCLYQVLKEPVISDDSGIEVDAMDKRPGVYSARFMGEDTDYAIKNQAIIDAVKGKVKTARYVCVIAISMKMDRKKHIGQLLRVRSMIDQSAKKALGMIQFFIIHRFKQL